MTTTKKKTSIEEIRRIELIQAAHRVFMEFGLSGMTTSRICKEAGMSPGILAYYFKGKDEVLFGMVRYNNRILMEDVITRMRNAKTRWQRLVAIIEGNFPDHAFERNTANAWLSVCAAAGTSSGFEKLQAIFYRRLSSNLSSALAELLPSDQINQLIFGIGVMIDGLWLRKSAGNDLSSATAVSLVTDYITLSLSAEDMEKLHHAY